MQQRVNGPAIGLIVTGALGFLFLLLHLLGLALDGEKQIMELQRDLDPEVARGVFYGVNAFLILLNLAASSLLIFAGLRMRQLKSWVLCVVACFVSMVPCYVCCCVGVSFGVWGLFVLLNDEVKQAFKN